MRRSLVKELAFGMAAFSFVGAMVHLYNFMGYLPYNPSENMFIYLPMVIHSNFILVYVILGIVSVLVGISNNAS